MARWTQARCKATYRAALAWPAAGTFALAGPSSFPMPSLVCALAGTSSVPMPSLMTRPSLVILGETRSTFAPAAQQPAASSSKRKLESTMTLEGAARAPAWVGTIAAGAAAFALGWWASARRASNAHTFADSNQLLALIKARRSIFPKVSRLVNPAP